MICKKCGYRSDDNAKFCRSCGERLSADEIAEQPPATPEAAVPREKRSYSRLLWLILVVLFLVFSDVFLLPFIINTIK